MQTQNYRFSNLHKTADRFYIEIIVPSTTIVLEL